ncbi:RNA 2',3'-cyclic phosphodiesterase [Patescibacteria group bacterium]|nr:RNA 2',3'-cyclic phosphodiesterase [Patescibacteria group bacterium]
MRAFIALELPEEIRTSLRENLVSGEIKKEIGKIQRDLKKAGVQARWVKPELSHLTLAFLGSITPEKGELIEGILKKVASQIKPVQLHLLKIGCFPSLTKARIVFVDLGGELGKLNALAIKIRKQLKKEKIYFDKKPFVSHVTLGRIRKRQNLTLLIRKTKIKKVKFVASEVSLTKSTLTESGPIYKNLAIAKLR